MKRWTRYLREIRQAFRSVSEARRNNQVFVYFGVPIEDARQLEREELIEVCGVTAAILLGRMTPAEADERAEVVKA